MHAALLFASTLICKINIRDQTDFESKWEVLLVLNSGLLSSQIKREIFSFKLFNIMFVVVLFVKANFFKGRK